MKAMNATTHETGPRLRVPPLCGAGDADAAAVDALRRFHLGAPDAPAGEVPAGAVPAAFAPAGADPAGEQPAHVLTLLRAAVAEAQAAARRGFARRARELAARADDLLETERLKGINGRDPEGLRGSMGVAAGRFVDPTALSGMLGEPRLSGTLGERRVRCLEEAAALLRETAGQIEAPLPTLVHDGTLPEAIDGVAGQGWAVLESSDPCAVAADLFDQQASRTARVLLAARRVCLEAAGDYDPARHDLLLGGDLDWQAFTRDELALLPPIVALESADQLAARGMLSLSKLLLSGRPLQVLVMEDPTGAPGADSPASALAGFRFQAAYLGLAQREAFVQQGSIARPELLSAAFRRAAGLARGALHVVEAPAASVPPEAAIAGRAHPLFRYDPEAGTSWADRMDFSGNPEPAEDWPVRELAVEADSGGETVLEAAFTFADACLLTPELAAQFLPLPEGVPAEALATFPEWLALGPEEALERVPYLLAVVPLAKAESRLVRLAVARPLALACRDRLGYWRTLQELAGVRSEYVRRAELRAREEAERRLVEERERLEARHARDLLRVRRRAVEDVVNRLTAAVLGVDGAAFESPLATLAGGDLDEVSESLLEMTAGADPERDGGGREATDEGDVADEAVDQVMAELTDLLGAADYEETATPPEAGGGQPSSRAEKE